MERGTQLTIDVSEDKFIPRPIIESELKEILRPSKDQSFYHMICGEYGSGKSLLIRKVSREIGHGIIYVDIPFAVEDFGIVFGAALNFAFEENITLTKQLLRKIGGTDGELIIAALL